MYIFASHLEELSLPLLRAVPLAGDEPGQRLARVADDGGVVGGVEGELHDGEAEAGHPADARLPVLYYRVTIQDGKNFPSTYFRHLRQLVCRYCSYILPSQDGGSSQIIVAGWSVNILL